MSIRQTTTVVVRGLGRAFLCLSVCLVETLRFTRYIGVLYYLAHCAASPVASCPGDGSYKSTRLPDVYTPTQNHLF